MNESNRRAINSLLVSLGYPELKVQEEFFLQNFYPKEENVTDNCYALSAALIILNQRKNKDSCITIDFKLFEKLAEKEGCSLPEVEVKPSAKFFIGIPNVQH